MFTIAIIGTINTDKTTLLNAILCDFCGPDLYRIFIELLFEHIVNKGAVRMDCHCSGGRFKDSFNSPPAGVHRILWPFLQAPGLDPDFDYQVYKTRLGTDPEYPLDVEQVERYLLMGRYSIKLTKNGEVIKHPGRTSGIMVIVDTGSDISMWGDTYFYYTPGMF